MIPYTHSSEGVNVFSFLVVFNRNNAESANSVVIKVMTRNGFVDLQSRWIVVYILVERLCFRLESGEKET